MTLTTTNKPHVLVMGPVPPEFGGANGGGVHSSLTDVHAWLDVPASVLVTNPGPRTPGAAISAMFQRVLLYPKDQSPLSKLGYVLRSLGVLGLRRTVHAAGAAVWYGFSPLRFLFNSAVLARAVREVDPDVVHIHMGDHPATYGRIVVRDRPLVVTIHSFSSLKNGSGWLRWRTKRLVRDNLARLRHAVVVSGAVRAEAESRFGFHAGTLVPNGIDTELYRPRGDQGFEDLRVVFSGALIPFKSVDTLVLAAARLRDRGVPVRVDIIGDGPEREFLTMLVKREQVEDRVRLLGPKDRHALRELLPEYQAIVIPSVAEGLSISMLEALSSGLCAVIVKPEHGTYGAVSEGETGEFFRYRDPEHLADQLQRLAKDPARCLRLGRSARELVMRDFDIRETANSMTRLFQAVYQDKGGR